MWEHGQGGYFSRYMQRPKKHVRLTNTVTGVTYPFQFNPAEWEEALGAEYARHTVPGLSHEVLQFINTRNREVSLELWFDNSNYPAKRMGGNPIPRTRRWLRSLVYPRAGGGRISGGAPRVLFSWPGFISFTAVVVDMVFTYAAFNMQGGPTSMKVEITLVEILDQLRLMEEVLDLEGE